MICSDFERVYEIAPAFRAENSLTNRHLTEFISMDLEMTIEKDYKEIIDLFDMLFVDIFEKLQKNCSSFIENVNSFFPHEKFKHRPYPSLRLQFKEGIEMLRSYGKENNIPINIGDFDDLNTENERLLGKIVKDKYQTDFFILEKFPSSVRPFYTMPDPVDKV